MKTTITYIDEIPVHINEYEESDYSTDSQKSNWTEICNSCEFKNNDRCGNCGCLFESLMNLATATCPIGKW
jgi:hypothetical protein